MDNNRINDELSLDDLENITGGVPKTGQNAPQAQLSRIACINCGEVCMVDLRKSSYVCPACRTLNKISG